MHAHNLHKVVLNLLSFLPHILLGSLHSRDILYSSLFRLLCKIKYSIISTSTSSSLKTPMSSSTEKRQVENKKPSLEHLHVMSPLSSANCMRTNRIFRACIAVLTRVILLIVAELSRHFCTRTGLWERTHCVWSDYRDDLPVESGIGTEDAAALEH